MFDGAVGKDVVSRTWREVKGDWDLWYERLDRLVHNAHRLQRTGESMRKQNARNQTLDAAPRVMVATQSCAPASVRWLLRYVAGILPNTSVWASGTGPLPPKKWSGNGRPPKLIRRDSKHQPISVKELALGLPRHAWRTIGWREGTIDVLSSRFARVRVRAAHRDYNLTASRSEEWLLIEWPKGEKAPTKYWLSTVPETVSFRRLVDLAKLRWRIERDYQELKQEVGLGHYIMRDADGAASTITRRCASRLTDS